MKGPGIFLAQFLRDNEPYNNLENIGKWVADLGYKGVQIPTWDTRVIDLDKAAESKGYCDDLRGKLTDVGLEISELSAHLQGQVLAIHPAYEVAFGPFYPENLTDKERTKWAAEQLRMAVLASANLGLNSVPVLSGGFAWHMMYPWPQRPPGLIEAAPKELPLGLFWCRPAPTSSMGRLLRCFWMCRKITPLCVYAMIQATSCFNNWIISSSYGFTGSGSSPFTSRTPSSDRPDASVFTVVISPGLGEPR